jgi:thiamine biosynthesis lipoprotein
MSRQAEFARRFDCFGGTVTVHVGGRSPSGATAQLAAMLAQGRLLDLHARLSRFEPASELSLLNADPRDVVPASGLLRRLAHAVVDAAQRSGGLVDATLVGALERAGYGASKAGAPGLDPAALASDARLPQPARPHPAAAWRGIVVDDRAHTITRPPGVRIDSGGLGKGLAADLVADLLGRHAAFAVDCCGDVRIGGRARVARRIVVEDPAGGAPLHELSIVDGAVATSGIARRSWLGADGYIAHHLLDPATGRPAWTGVVQATALAPTALEAEALAKAALLAGPARGRELLPHGGVLVLDGGDVDVVSSREPAASAA